MDFGQPGFERIVTQFYAQNMVIALPLTLLLIKIIVRFVTREARKDIFRSLLTLPLDLVYVAFGLLLAGMTGRIPAFISHYDTPKSAIAGGFIICFCLFWVACLITWIDRGIRLLWQKFYAAWKLSIQAQGAQTGQQMSLLGQQGPPITKVAVVYLWMFVYWTMMISLTSMQVVLAMISMATVLKRIQ
jgi:hypothetical protein